MMSRFFQFSVLVIFLVAAVSLKGQGTVTIIGISELNESVKLDAENIGPDQAASIQIEGTDTLDSPNWIPLPSVLSPASGPSTLFIATVPKSLDSEKYFYRILAIAGSVGDLDGDGLADEFESNDLLTNASLFDSDGDGFSDGQEFAYGTDPLDPASKPVFVQLPTVSFSLANSIAREGDGPHQMEIVFDRPYNGTVNYAVNALGNTTAGTDFTLGVNPLATTGSIPVNGTSAFIPISIVNDDIVNDQRAAIIDIALNGEEYFLGGRFTHVVIIEDNDAWWTGSLIPASGENDGRTFRLKIVETGAGTIAKFGAGAGLDGLPIPEVETDGGGPAIGDTSNSSSIIPDGEWDGVVGAASGSHFSVTTPELPVPTGSLFPNEQLRRTLSLNAELALNSPGRPHELANVRYIGDYVESLTSSAGAPLATFPGSFILVRDIPAPLPVLSNLVPDTQ